ncbi:retrovirus-related pol polyprotein from transposon TNT 1-94 [Tanacetum coccineum]
MIVKGEGLGDGSFCCSIGTSLIKREYSNARTPQQNRVAERKNRTLIEVARTMLEDLFLPNTFWANAVSTACYVLNRELVTKPHNKTPYELLTGKTPIISYIRPFGCHVTILNTIDHLGKFAKEVDYEILDKKYPIIDWKTENLGTKPQIDESKRSEEINMNVVTRSNGQKRSFSTLIRVLSVFDREDLDAVYKLVMDIYQDKIPEGFDKVLWGDLIVMFNSDEQDEFWNSQHEWKVVSWKLHSSSGVHTLMTDEGLVVHMLIEKKYPLKKEILMQMLKLKLESEEESTMALELIRFIKKSWLVQDQTVLGKDYSNLLIADSLLKTIWFINAPCYDNEALASPNTNDEELSIPEQTATGKGTSNPLMAGSLPKTTKPT